MDPKHAIRIRRGALWGVYATAAMTALMLLGMLTGIAPMPEPIPVALAASLLAGAPKPMLMVTGLVAHFAYGAVAAGIFARFVTRIGLTRGLLFGGGLWLVMQLVFLPILGWGPFGVGVTPKIAVATLLLHLVYGGVLMGIDRQELADDTAVTTESSS